MPRTSPARSLVPDRHEPGDRPIKPSPPAPLRAVAGPVAGGVPVAPRLAAKVPHVLRSGLGLALIASAVVTAVVVVGLDGWRYYWTPEDVRAYTDLHPLLRPSGAVGRALGIGGLGLMLVMHLYSLRKRVPTLTWMGPVTLWLELHIFCGVLGPVLITFHTSFKFNGLISVAYWSMVIVVASGFVGRYLYVRIPRSIKGHELGHAELVARAAELRSRLLALDVPETVAARIDALEEASVPSSEDRATWLGLVLGDPRLRVRLWLLARELRRTVADQRLVADLIALLAERDVLLRRIVYLRKTKKLFDLWRVYHKPLAVLMAIIVALHVGVAWYFGYAYGAR